MLRISFPSLKAFNGGYTALVHDTDTGEVALTVHGATLPNIIKRIDALRETVPIEITADYRWNVFRRSA